MFSTVGVHPSDSDAFDDSGDPQGYLNKLLQLATNGKKEGIVCAVGEMGLDYDRLFKCTKPVQQKYDRVHFVLNFV